MSTDCLLPAYWNPDICVATSAMNRPRLFTHWIPRLQVCPFYGLYSVLTEPNHLDSQILNERSLLQLRQQPTHSRLKSIDDYLEGARRGEDKEYAFVSESNTTTHKRDKSTLSVLGENITTCIASPSRTDPSSPGRHLSRPVTRTLTPTFSQCSDLSSPTTSSSGAPNLLLVEEDSCLPEYLPQRTCTYRDGPDVPSSGGVLSVSIVEA